MGTIDAALADLRRDVRHPPPDTHGKDGKPSQGFAWWQHAVDKYASRNKDAEQFDQPTDPGWEQFKRDVAAGRYDGTGISPWILKRYGGA